MPRRLSWWTRARIALVRIVMRGDGLLLDVAFEDMKPVAVRRGKMLFVVRCHFDVGDRGPAPSSRPEDLEQLQREANELRAARIVAMEHLHRPGGGWAN